MGWVASFLKSSLGAKVVMALTGLALVGFVLSHMLGNWQIFIGQDAINAYAEFLKAFPHFTSEPLPAYVPSARMFLVVRSAPGHRATSLAI